MSSWPSKTIETGIASEEQATSPRAALPTARARDSRRRSRLIDAAAMVLIFVCAIVVFFDGIESTPFHQDESRWLNRAHYLTDLADPFGPTWNDQYLTRGQPPVGSYMMGLGLLVQGRDLNTNNAWDFRRSEEFNRQNNAYPEQGDHIAGRRTNSVLGAAAASIVYLVIRQLTNPIGGIAGALFLIANPLQTWHNRLALADTTLTITLALLLFCVIQLMRRPSWTWAILTGILIGIGGANKFTPMALCAPLAGIGMLLIVRSWWDGRKLGRATRGFSGLPPIRDLGWMLLSVPFVTGMTFVLIYPYLWPSPVRRTLALIQFRQDEMANQYRIYAHLRTDTPADALNRTIIALGDAWSSTENFLSWIGLPDLGASTSRLDLVLGITGLVALIIVGFVKGLRSAELAVASIIFFQTATIILTMRVDFERYYLPILLGLVVAIGCSIGYTVFGVRWLAERGRKTRRLDAASIPPQ